jgi:transcriptional regulator with XRE-family HTH domain
MNLDSDQQWEKREAQAQRFAEVIRHAQKVCRTGTAPRASQRELADRLQVAGTMVTRYISGRVQFENIKTETAQLIADAAGISVGSLYAWIQEGRERAMEVEARVKGQPVAFTPRDLAAKLLELLEQEEGTPPEPERLKRRDWSLQKRQLIELEAQSPTLFGRFVATLGAESVLAKLEFGEDLDEVEEEKLQELLR